MLFNILSILAIWAIILSVYPPVSIFIFQHLTKPRAILEILDCEFIKEEYDGIIGYRLKAKVVNKGKRIVYYIKPQVKVTDLNGNYVELLRVNIKEKGGGRKGHSKVEARRLF